MPPLTASSDSYKRRTTEVESSWQLDIRLGCILLKFYSTQHCLASDEKCCSVNLSFLKHAESSKPPVSKYVNFDTTGLKYAKFYTTTRNFLLTLKLTYSKST